MRAALGGSVRPGPAKAPGSQLCETTSNDESRETHMSNHTHHSPARHRTPCLVAGLALAAAAGMAGLGAPTVALAASQPDFYIGGTLGVASISPRGYEIQKDGAADGRLSGGLFAGARLTTLNLGKDLPLFLELGYQDIARHKITYKVGATTSQLTAQGESLYAAAKLDIPFTDSFGMFVRLGAARNKVDGSTPAGAPVIDIDGRKTSLLVGAGVQWHLGSSFTLRTDLTSLGKASKNADAGTFNLGLAYRF
jgi:opacity protein-like surface antigen